LRREKRQKENLSLFPSSFHLFSFLREEKIRKESRKAAARNLLYARKRIRLGRGSGLLLSL
jgi:hypothetical protein